jgi:hypothetical protein
MQSSGYRSLFCVARVLWCGFCCLCSRAELRLGVKLKEKPTPYMGEVRTKVKVDLLVDCTRQRLVPAHAEGPVNKLK